MRHYFIDSEHPAKDFFVFESKFNEQHFVFHSCSDVFSKDKLDDGSVILVKTIIKNYPSFSGKVLDMGCGYGTISILLSRFFDNATFDMCDINSTAISLAATNAKANHTNADKILQSNLFENISGSYDFILSNPPIKTGKKLLFDFAQQSKDHLKPLGELIVVIKKNLGANSLKNHLTEIFGNATVIARDRGYYILRSVRH